jgi:hypothetical protein
MIFLIQTKKHFRGGAASGGVALHSDLFSLFSLFPGSLGLTDVMVISG